MNADNLQSAGPAGTFAVRIHVSGTLCAFSIVSPVATISIVVQTNGLVAESTRFSASCNHFLGFARAPSKSNK